MVWSYPYRSFSRVGTAVGQAWDGGKKGTESLERSMLLGNGNRTLRTCWNCMRSDDPGWSRWQRLGQTLDPWWMVSWAELLLWAPSAFYFIAQQLLPDLCELWYCCLMSGIWCLYLSCIAQVFPPPPEIAVMGITSLDVVSRLISCFARPNVCLGSAAHRFSWWIADFWYVGFFLHKWQLIRFPLNGFHNKILAKNPHTDKWFKNKIFAHF